MVSLSLTARHPCFDASVVITISGFGGEIFLSACWILSIHRCKSSLADLLNCIFASKFQGINFFVFEGSVEQRLQFYGKGTADPMEAH